jgi:antigen flippase
VSTSTLLLGGVSCMLALAGAIAAAPVSDLVLHDGGRHAALVRLLMLAVPFAVTAQTYRALLSAARAVPQLVRNQIISDVGSAIVFGVLVVPFGLGGAILGFMTAHLILFVAGLLSARRVLRQALMPRWTYFRWSIVRSNIGFSASGLVMIALSNLSVLFVSRILIGRLGLEANGIFSNAWRIASVYLGAITATTISYVLPTLSQARDSESLNRDLNEILRFYLVALPPVMVGIMTTGEILIWLILSSTFAAVAPLLLFFIPAELFRVLGETMAVPLLARRRMLAFTLVYLVQAAIFVGSAAILIPAMGVEGAAIAYAISTVSGAMIEGATAFATTGARIESGTWLIGSSSVGLVAAAGAVCAWSPLGLGRLLANLLLVTIWFSVNSRNEKFMDLVRGGLRLVAANRS